MSFDHLVQRDEATAYLAEALREGTLTLFLGAGASRGAALPDWPTLVYRLQRESPVKSTVAIPERASADDLQIAADEVRSAFADTGEFLDLLTKVLYEGVELNPQLLQTELLSAIGALLAGSRRGSVRRVMTLNFDSTLEWYLALYGLVPLVVHRHSMLEGAEDVRIYHPHGFLPHPAMDLSRSSDVILGLDQVNLRIGRVGDPWFEMMRHTLATSICLFVGLSQRTFRDRSLAPLLAAVRTQLEDVNSQRPLGFWLCRDTAEGSDEPLNNFDAVQREFLRAGVVPIFWHDEAEVPAFLLSICQAAAAKII